MLPIRLGMLNSVGEQDLFVFTLTRMGRVETANYRTVTIPTDIEIPNFVEDEFDDFYRAMFKRQAERNPGVTFLEYAWDMNWFDPCATDPLRPAELCTLGAWWVDPADTMIRPLEAPARAGAKEAPARAIASEPPIAISNLNAYVTRMHLRYTSVTHPDDLVFHETDIERIFKAAMWCVIPGLAARSAPPPRSIASICSSGGNANPKRSQT